MPLNTPILLGIVTYSLLIITLILGLFRKQLGMKSLLLHKIFAFLTFISASVHAGYIILLYTL